MTASVKGADPENMHMFCVVPLKLAIFLTVCVFRSRYDVYLLEAATGMPLTELHPAVFCASDHPHLPPSYISFGGSHWNATNRAAYCCLSCIRSSPPPSALYIFSSPPSFLFKKKKYSSILFPDRWCKKVVVLRICKDLFC